MSNDEFNKVELPAINQLKKLPKSDILLMFKLYDLIIPKNKKQKKKISEDIINILKTMRK